MTRLSALKSESPFQKFQLVATGQLDGLPLVQVLHQLYRRLLRYERAEVGNQVAVPVSVPQEETARGIRPEDNVVQIAAQQFVLPQPWLGTKSEGTRPGLTQPTNANTKDHGRRIFQYSFDCNRF